MPSLVEACIWCGMQSHNVKTVIILFIHLPILIGHENYLLKSLICFHQNNCKIHFCAYNFVHATQLLAFAISKIVTPRFCLNLPATNKMKLWSHGWKWCFSKVQFLFTLRKQNTASFGSTRNHLTVQGAEREVNW